MNSRQGSTGWDIENLQGELTAVERSRREDLHSEGEEQFDGYRVAYAKAELLAGFCRSHPEVVNAVRGEMDEMRAAFGQGPQ